MSYEAGKKFHAYDQYIDKQKCLALLSWYAFTVCDTVSGFNSYGENLSGLCGKHFLK